MIANKLYKVRFLFFISAIILLSVLNLSGNSIEIKRPVILLVGSLFALFNFKNSSRFLVIVKLILLYLIEMFFNQLSGRFVHIGSFSVHLSLIAIMPLAISFMCCKSKKANTLSIETIDLFKSWAIVFAVIILHMLFLFLLLKNIYGYGYEHDFAILANMCLYFLVFIFTWEQLEQRSFRRITALISTVFFIVIMVRIF